MKKLTKALLYIMAGLALVGILLTIAGAIGGGFRKFPSIYYSGAGLVVSEFNVTDNGSDMVRAISKEQAFDTADVKNLSISIGAREVLVKESTDNKIHIINNGKRNVETYVSGETLYIEDKDSSIKAVGINIGSSENITIFLPKNMSFEDIEYNMGAVGFKQDVPISCKNLDIDLGAGSISIKDLKADKLGTNLGAGSMEISGAEVGKMDIELGMGSFNYTGSLAGDMNLECSMGSANIKLANDIKDYNFKCDVSAGTIKYGNEKITNASVDKEVNNGSKSTIDIDCSMGTVVVDFK